MLWCGLRAQRAQGAAATVSVIINVIYLLYNNVCSGAVSARSEPKARDLQTWLRLLVLYNNIVAINSEPKARDLQTWLRDGNPYPALALRLPTASGAPIYTI